MHTVWRPYDTQFSPEIVAINTYCRGSCYSSTCVPDYMWLKTELSFSIMAYHLFCGKWFGKTGIELSSLRSHGKICSRNMIKIQNFYWGNWNHCLQGQGDHHPEWWESASSNNCVMIKPKFDGTCRQWNKSSLVQVMAWCRFSSEPSHYMNQWWLLVNWTLTHWGRVTHIFIQENAFQNVVWKMTAILPRPQCVV